MAWYMIVVIPLIIGIAMNWQRGWKALAINTVFGVAISLNLTYLLLSIVWSSPIFWWSLLSLLLLIILLVMVVKLWK